MKFLANSIPFRTPNTNSLPICFSPPTCGWSLSVACLLGNLPQHNKYWGQWQGLWGDNAVTQVGTCHFRDIPGTGDAHRDPTEKPALGPTLLTRKLRLRHGQITHQCLSGDPCSEQTPPHHRTGGAGGKPADTAGSALLLS